MQSIYRLHEPLFSEPSVPPLTDGSPHSPHLQVQRGAETHGGVQPTGHGELGGLGGHAEPRHDKGQHRRGGAPRGPQGDDGALL